jgi:hypothetical protein
MNKLTFFNWVFAIFSTVFIIMLDGAKEDSNIVIYMIYFNTTLILCLFDKK